MQVIMVVRFAEVAMVIPLYFVLWLYSTIKKNRDAYVKRLNDIYKNNLDKDHVEHIAGHAQFTGPKDVVVGDRALTAKHILIATGTKPIVPSVPGEICLNGKT